ncbi:MAG: hypothetical protein ACPK7O_06500 [Methanobacterium sp.]
MLSISPTRVSNVLEDILLKFSRTRPCESSWDLSFPGSMQKTVFVSGKFSSLKVYDS